MRPSYASEQHMCTLSPPGVVRLLWPHAEATAERAVERLGGPLRQSNLEQFLRDTACLGCPTSLYFDPDTGPVAEPEFSEEEDERHCCLHIHPRYSDYPEAITYIVAYMAASIIYGDDADPALKERLGAKLVQQPREAFARRMNAWAELR